MDARPEVSDQAVYAKTGRRWKAWFAELDAAGASGWKHAQIARHLGEGYGLDPWWRQTVAVSYERARGLRDRHEQPDGYQIQRQRVLPVPVEEAWQAWKDPALRRQWLPEAEEASLRGEPPKQRYVRLDWIDGRTRVLIGFQPYGDGRSSAGVQHSKLPDREAAERMKAYWAERLDTLQALFAKT